MADATPVLFCFAYLVEARRSGAWSWSSGVEELFNTVIEVLRDRLTVVEVAELYVVSRQAVHGWLRRYSARGDVGDSRVVG